MLWHWSFGHTNMSAMICFSDHQIIGSLSKKDGDVNENDIKAIERFHSRGHHLCKFIGTKESFCIIKEKNPTPTGLVWDTNMAAVSLFWDTNMAFVRQNNNSAHASRFFIHFFAVTARLRRENA